MRFVTWNVWSPYWVCSMKTASELAEYMLDLVAVHEVRWDNGSSEPPYYYTFFCA
jgi:hypothetical protein